MVDIKLFNFNEAEVKNNVHPFRQENAHLIVFVRVFFFKIVTFFSIEALIPLFVNYLKCTEEWKKIISSLIWKLEYKYACIKD